MRKNLRYVVLQILFISGSIIFAFVIFILAARYHLKYSLNDIFSAEKKIFHLLLTGTRYIFPNTYIIHTVLIYLMAGYTVMVILIKSLSYSIRSLRRLITTDVQRKRASLMFVFLLPVTLVFTGLEIKESQYRKMGFFPGSLYPWMDFSQSHPNITREIIADERGMTFYDHDSFPRHSYPRRFVVNKQGFPNPFDFDRHTIDSLAGEGTHRKKKRLVLGDSFVEGMGASGFDSCFMEIYRQRNQDQLICCASIHGSDPVQYRLFAEKLIPEIRPDEVDVMFCGANDVMRGERKPVPYIPLFSEIEGVGTFINYMDMGNGSVGVPPDKAYHIYRKANSLMENTDALSILCRQSNVTTHFYFDFLSTSLPQESPPDSGATYRNLRKIKNLADSAGVRFSIIFIPTPMMVKYGVKEYTEHFKWVFGDLWQYVVFPPKGLITQNDCISEINTHFYDRGQMKFADFLQKEWAK